MESVSPAKTTDSVCWLWLCVRKQERRIFFGKIFAFAYFVDHLVFLVHFDGWENFKVLYSLSHVKDPSREIRVESFVLVLDFFVCSTQQLVINGVD